MTKATPVHGRHLTAQAAQKPAKVAIAPASKPSQKLANGKISRILRAAAYEYTYNVRGLRCPIGQHQPLPPLPTEAEGGVLRRVTKK